MIDGEKLKGKILEYHAAGLCGDDTKDNILEMLRDCQIDARIEAAIRELEKPLGVTWEKSLAMMKDMTEGRDTGRWGQMEADLLRWVLGQPQPTWKPEDFGLGPEKEELQPVTDKDRRY